MSKHRITDSTSKRKPSGSFSGKASHRTYTIIHENIEWKRCNGIWYRDGSLSDNIPPQYVISAYVADTNSLLDLILQNSTKKP